MIRNDIDVRSLEFRVFCSFRTLKSKILRLDYQNLGYLIFYVVIDIIKLITCAGN